MWLPGSISSDYDGAGDALPNFRPRIVYLRPQIEHRLARLEHLHAQIEHRRGKNITFDPDLLPLELGILGLGVRIGAVRKIPARGRGRRRG